MADLKQRILLDGIDQIKAGFAAIGAAGREAFEAINRVRLSPERFNAANEAAQRLGRSLRSVGSSADDFGNRFRSSVKTISLASTTVLGLAAAFVKLVQSASDAADGLDEASQAAGLSTQEFETLRGSIKQSGIDAEGFQTILSRFNRSVDEARSHSGEFEKKQSDLIHQFNAGTISAADYTEQMTELKKANEKSSDAFVRLGIRVLGADNKSRKITDVLGDLAAKFETMPDGVEKTAIAIDIFGRAGQRMVPFLNQGRDGIAKLNAETQRLSPTLSGVQLAVGRNLADAFDRLTLASVNLKNQFFLLFAPIIQRAVDGLTEAIVTNREAILNLGRSIIASAKPALLDLLAVIRGDEATKGGFVDRVIETLKALGEGIQIVISIFNSLIAVADTVAETINSIFGTEFTGKGLVVAAIILQLVGAFGLFGTAIGLVTAAVTALSAAIGFIITLFGPRGIAIGIIIGAITALYIKLGGIEGIQVLFEQFVTWFESTWVGRFVAAIGVVMRKVAELAAWIASKLPDFGGGDGKITVGGAGTPTGFAEGGGVRGPGSGTSDSILARLSNGEYVIKAAAVKKFGSGFFDAINNFRLPGFASGGLVASVPSGGNGLHPVTLVMPNGASFTGIQAEPRTVAELPRGRSCANKQHGKAAVMGAIA